MPIIDSKLNPRAADFQANAAQMRTLVADLRAKIARNALGGGEGPRS